MHTHYGHRVRMLNGCTDQIMTSALAQMDLTASQGRVLGYLVHHPQPPCAHDIETAFHLSHPTVSGILSRMEKKGFLEQRTDPQDKRFKRIYLLPKGDACTARMEQVIQSIERRIVGGFSEEEQRQFADLLERAILNMGGSPCNQTHKEDPT